MKWLSYWTYPVISGLCWLSMLLGLLVHWNVKDRPHYRSMNPNQHIVYISDVGAESLKPLFVAGCCMTAVFLDLSFISERWLRSTGRLAPNSETFQKILSFMSMWYALIGTVGLVLLSIYDTLRHPTLHDIFLILFIGGYVTSAVFLCWGYQRLGIHYPQHAALRYSFYTKLSFILIELCLAIAFVTACNRRDAGDAAACLEWAIAFIFTFYVMSFLFDLSPAIHTKNNRFVL